MIYRLLVFQNLLQVYHWQTKNYSHHIIVGELYNKFIKLTDKFVETYQKNISFKNKSIPLDNMNEKKINELLEHMKQFLLEQKITEVDLINIRDEMVMEINRGLYLLAMD